MRSRKIGGTAAALSAIPSCDVTPSAPLESFRAMTLFLIIQRLANAVWWSPGEAGGKTVFCRFNLNAGSGAHSP
ncbi:hypothetical protein GCM10010319_35290 [Streptomyces blastmyceticus]|uniref:Uncharacterized protein n=1 Tax=Streptomyces blastmyceticus TaxID=68180 RepID=A0ABP3GXG0_9ACTN